MKTVLMIGVVLALAATACGEVADDSAVTTTMAGADTAAEVETTDGALPSEELPAGSESNDADSTELSPVTTIPEERVVDESGLPERVPPSEEVPVTGEADSGLVANVEQDLISRTGAAEADITIIRSEEVIWSDGSLGCPEPGEFYTQAQVSGYWVVLEYGGQTYDYRANDRGFFKLCEGFGAPPSNPTG